jgi:hypothetical protein
MEVLYHIDVGPKVDITPPMAHGPILESTRYQSEVFKSFHENRPLKLFGIYFMANHANQYDANKNNVEKIIEYKA